ncbi:Zinc finger CCCH domain-containing protein 47 [Trypanosoma brucei equiperdum]|uniref:Zinc finger CCCH domain-containing protein 47 n=1 Tax=Trypanosoma brucei equiperdum TaxID=630700 RepID=A0A3L6LFP0_9TRYP|nr:Zinc finger CCCH domain-containing protein 47 [Trypanosoma brucei equiperdum]
MRLYLQGREKERKKNAKRIVYEIKINEGRHVSGGCVSALPLRLCIVLFCCFHLHFWSLRSVFHASFLTLYYVSSPLPFMNLEAEK